MWFARLLGGSLALGVAILPAVSLARQAYAQPPVVVQGRIASFDGRYDLKLRDGSGREDDVRLKHGTVINPRGRRLRAGMPVVIRALDQGRTLLALRIDDLSRVMAMKHWQATLQRYRRAQYAQARTAATQLADRLERMYGPSVAVAAPLPSRHAHRPVRTLAAGDPQEIQPTWYGWGKL